MYTAGDYAASSLFSPPFTVINSSYKALAPMGCTLLNALYTHKNGGWVGFGAWMVGG